MQWPRKGIELRPSLRLEVRPVIIFGKADVMFENDLSNRRAKSHESERFADAAVWT